MEDIKFTCSSLTGTNKKGTISKDKDGYYDMVIGGLNILNSAGEYYEYNGAKELFKSSSSFYRRIKRGALRGEVGHPRRQPYQSLDDYMARILDIDEKNVCVHFAEVYLDFENFSNPDGTKAIAIRSKLAPSGPKAEFLAKAIENPRENVCFSIRSFTKNTMERGRLNKVIRNVVTFDYVNEPGISIAEKYKSPSLESFGDVQNIEELSVERGYLEKAFSKRHEGGIAQESGLMTRQELFDSFGWVDTSKPRYTTW